MNLDDLDLYALRRLVSREVELERSKMDNGEVLGVSLKRLSRILAELHLEIERRNPA